jgi:hypothetical protein
LAPNFVRRGGEVRDGESEGDALLRRFDFDFEFKHNFYFFFKG